VDGSLFDKLNGESPTKRIRLVTYEYAIERFPQLVLLLLKRKLLTSVSTLRDGMEIITLSHPLYPEYFYQLLRDDFEKIKKVISQIDLSLFPSETTADVIKRIEAYIKQEFSDRKI